MPDFFVYVILWPDGTPFYVGSGKASRLRGVRRNNKEVCRILDEIRASGQTHTKTVEKFDNEPDARKRELDLIKLWGRSIDGGLLANLRIGDRGGVQGRKISQEQIDALQNNRVPHTDQFKKRLRQRMIGNKYAAGRTLTPEQRAVRSQQTRDGIARARARKVENRDVR